MSLNDKQSHSCPICKSASNYWFSKQNRDHYRCANCKIIWIPAGLVLNQNGTTIYEETDNSVFLQDGNENYYLDETNFNSCDKKIQWMKKFLLPKAKVCDIGANFGHFLKTAQNEFDIVGIEPSFTAVNWSKQNLTVNNHVGSVYAIPSDLQSTYDAVTFWDVIEHIPDSYTALKNIYNILKPGGYFFLSTPDTASLMSKVLGKKWYYYDPIQHIILFNRNNLTQLLEKIGFTIEGITYFGHYYRIQYIFDRLSFLNQESFFSPFINFSKLLMKPFARQKVYLNFHDVIGIVAKKI